jgi:predicted transposase YbfD/YdcC
LLHGIDGVAAQYGREVNALHTVSVWAHDQGVVSGSAQVPEKSNEITVIPELLETLDISGAVVTIDAMGTQKQIAWVIREHHADYLLTLKANHSALLEDVKWLFGQNTGEAQWTSSNQGHGRQETREWWLLTDLSLFTSEQRSEWRDLSAVARVRSTRTLNDETTSQDRYYLTSLTDIEQVAHASRAHWSIENSLHWILDIAFRDDENRTWAGNAQANLVTLRHLALSLLKRDKSVKIGIQAKRRKAGWDTNYLTHVLNA